MRTIVALNCYAARSCCCCCYCRSQPCTYTPVLIVCVRNSFQFTLFIILCVFAFVSFCTDPKYHKTAVFVHRNKMCTRTQRDGTTTPTRRAHSAQRSRPNYRTKTHSKACSTHTQTFTRTRIHTFAQVDMFVSQ